MSDNEDNLSSVSQRNRYAPTTTSTYNFTPITTSLSVNTSYITHPISQIMYQPTTTAHLTTTITTSTITTPFMHCNQCLGIVIT